MQMNIVRYEYNNNTEDELLIMIPDEGTVKRGELIIYWIEKTQS